MTGMNRRQRRRAEAMARHTKHNNNNNSPAAGVPDISNMPDDIKNDIVALATIVNLVTIGGTCMFYAFTGKSAFAFAGIEAQRVVGGMMYRAGHHEMRDVVAFVGPGNVGCFHNGMFHGHQWLQVGDTLVDFSAGQWKSATEILVQAFEDGLGAVDWVVDRRNSFGDRGTASCRPPASPGRSGRLRWGARSIPDSEALKPSTTGSKTQTTNLCRCWRW